VAKWKGISPNTSHLDSHLGIESHETFQTNVDQFLVFRKSIGSGFKAFYNMKYLVILSLKIFLRKKKTP
jgi:hypothetical protein